MTALEWAEFTAAVVTAFALPLALVSYVGRKRGELRQQRSDALQAQERHDEFAFDRLHAEYLELLRLQLQYPELDLGDEPLVDPVVLDDHQRVQEAAMFNIFISLIERAHRLYHRTSDRAKVLEWRGWEEYLDEMLARPNFERLWIRHSGQYNTAFVADVNQRRSGRQQAQVDAVTVERVAAEDRSAVEFVVMAGKDPAAYLDTYMPRLPDDRGAHQWLQSMGENRFLVRVGREPVGLLIAHPPLSPGVPPDHLETSTYIAPVHRGLRLASAAWAIAEPMIRPAPSGLAGVVWERNTSAGARLARSGYSERGRVFYSSDDDGENGWCRLWVKPLTTD